MCRWFRVVIEVVRWRFAWSNCLMSRVISFTWRKATFYMLSHFSITIRKRTKHRFCSMSHAASQSLPFLWPPLHNSHRWPMHYHGLKECCGRNHRMSQFLLPWLPCLLGWVGGRKQLFTLGRLSGLKWLGSCLRGLFLLTICSDFSALSLMSLILPKSCWMAFCASSSAWKRRQRSKMTQTAPQQHRRSPLAHCYSYSAVSATSSSLDQVEFTLDSIHLFQTSWIEKQTLDPNPSATSKAIINWAHILYKNTSRIRGWNEMKI